MVTQRNILARFDKTASGGLFYNARVAGLCIALSIELRPNLRHLRPVLVIDRDTLCEP
jgi:hypothetical protein